MAISRQRRFSTAVERFGDGLVDRRFRLPCAVRPSAIVRFPFEELEVEIDRTLETTVQLRSGPPGTSLRDADVFALTGGPYPSDDLAQRAGEEWNVRLRRAFSGVGVTAKFERTPFWFSEQTLADHSAQLGRPVIPDDDGVITYAHKLEPVFIRPDVQGAMRPHQDVLLFALRSLHARPAYGTQDMFAYRLWSASDFVGHIAEARFAVLMIALESLASPSDRAGAQRAHIEELIRLTSASMDLTPEERQPIVSVLAGLRKHSVRQACILLAASMDGRDYDGMSPQRFVKHCYDRRNAMMHARPDHPTTQEANVLAANLSRFIGDLLAGRPLVDEIATSREALAKHPT